VSLFLATVVIQVRKVLWAIRAAEDFADQKVILDLEAVDIQDLLAPALPVHKVLLDQKAMSDQLV
jgi:hypothetical protein